MKTGQWEPSASLEVPVPPHVEPPGTYGNATGCAGTYHFSAKDIPFVLVGDPKKALYKEFGVETSLGFMSLKALGAGMRGMAHGHLGLRLSGGPLGLPGDFLIAPSGQIKAVKYGTHAYDQWSVDELIALAKGG